MNQEKLARINQLARKSRESQLTESELKEQQELRAEYLANFRNNFKNQIESIKVVDSEGNDLTSNKVKQQNNKD